MQHQLGSRFVLLAVFSIGCAVEDSSDDELRGFNPGFCGGIAGFPCPPGEECVDDPSDDCNPKKGGADCAGICIGPEFCGGIAGIPCEDPDDVCVDDPSDDCNPDKGGADCGGICVEPIFCGGFGGFPCPEGLMCVDDPRDDCDPHHGGADCGGLCVPDPNACVGNYCEF